MAVKIRVFKKYLRGSIVVGLAATVSFIGGGCSKNEPESDKTAGKTYSFDAQANAKLKMKGAALSRATTLKTSAAGPTLCSSVICFTPTVLTGKYYGTGFLIQSDGNGMVAYFGQDSWSSITGASKSYDFNSTSPIENSGTLTCCGGTGDLTSANTYIESIIYLFGYIDATFAVSGVTSNTSMNREFTVRFVLADGAIASGIRGDLLLKDPADGVFKWIDTSVNAGGNVGDGTLVATRPQTPIVLNSAVTNWTNPFGSTQGNQSIPVIYAPVLTSAGTGVYTVSESDLNTPGKTYQFSFDPTNMVIFPMLMASSDLNSLSTYAQLLNKISLGGLPHSGQPMGVGNPAGTQLTVTGP